MFLLVCLSVSILREKEDQWVLIDFGLCKRNEEGTCHTKGVGTEGYMAPEVFRSGDEAYDCKSDVFSLGLTIIHVVLSTTDFVARTSHARRDEQGGLFTNPAWLETKLKKLRLEEEMTKLIVGMVATDPAGRLSAEDVYGHAALKDQPDILETLGYHKSPEEPQEEAQNQLQDVVADLQEQLDIERARADNAEKELAEAKIQIAAMQEQGLEAGLENLQLQDDAAEKTAASLETTASAAKFNAFLGQFVLLSSEKAPLLDRKSFISDSVLFGDVDKYGPLFLFSCSILYYTKEHRTLAQANGTWPSLNSFLDTFASGVNPVSQEHIMRKGGEYGKRGLKSPNETSRRKGWKKDAKKVVDAIKVKVAEGGVVDASDLHGALFKIERAVNSVFDDNQFDSHGFGDVPEAPRRSFCLLLAAIHVRSNKQYAHNDE